jgi:integrase
MPILEIVWRNGIAQLHGTPPDQPRIRKSIRTRDPDQAETIRVAEEARLTRASVYGPEQETTFAQASVIYQEDKGTGLRYLKPIIAHFGNRRIATIKPGEIRKLARDLFPNAKAATRNRSVVKPTRAIINFAADYGLCNPLWVKGYKEAKVERDASDREWIDDFRAHAVNPYISALALFMWVTGARIGECVILRPQDFDLDNKRAFAERTKNGNPRTYYLTDELVEVLRALQPRMVHTRKGVPKELRVFGYSDRKGPVKPWKATCKAAGIKYLSPHEAGRHGFATEMIVRQKQDAVTTAKLGGWEDPVVLLKRYSHAQQLAQVAEASFGQNGTSLARARARRLKTITEQDVA